MILNKLQGDCNFPKAQALLCIRQTVLILTKTPSFSDCLSGLWRKRLSGAGRSLWRYHVHHMDFYVPTGTPEHPWATVPWAVRSSLLESKRLLYHVSWGLKGATAFQSDSKRVLQNLDKSIFKKELWRDCLLQNVKVILVSVCSVLRLQHGEIMTESKTQLHRSGGW